MFDCNLIILETIPSTNTYAKENINRLQLPSLIIANEQTAGRGRQGKNFFSPSDTGLYMTLVFEFPQNCNLLTPLAAVSVCEILRNYGVDPKIKWVNDIFTDGHKICGILTECFSFNQKSYIALGIGINLTTAKFPEELDIAGSAGIECDKCLLADEISRKIFDNIQNYDEKYILSEYKKDLFIIGKQITYSKNNTVFTATVKELNDQCNLIVEKENGTTDILSSGEISIKL